MRLNFDILSHLNKHREATNMYLILHFFLSLYKMPNKRCILNFQNVSLKCSLLTTVSFSIFHTEKTFPEALTLNTLTPPLKKPPDIWPHSFSHFPLPTSPFFITDQLGLPHLFSILTASSTPGSPMESYQLTWWKTSLFSKSQ